MRFVLRLQALRLVVLLPDFGIASERRLGHFSAIDDVHLLLRAAVVFAFLASWPPEVSVPLEPDVCAGHVAIVCFDALAEELRRILSQCALDDVLIQSVVRCAHVHAKYYDGLLEVRMVVPVADANHYGIASDVDAGLFVDRHVVLPAEVHRGVYVQVLRP